MIKMTLSSLLETVYKAMEPAGSAEQMIFNILNVENDVAAQGFQEGDYDVVVAANVLRATRSLAETVQHARTLLKTGGYLVLMEITGDSLAAIYRYTMGALPGWWLGVESWTTAAD
ncbi:hypothetical protein DHEL01_v209506 [Diaporthe helianthi]|uniref:Methyltransferase type 11 domain-containing protein n=1 Tax=Diaporthe helianthi TaxID=158607 RepID=A0A2P5HPF2_DIAHE|nr:hypothetical protein DHEL01_v209506 [Diaporthe helianthi]